MFSRLFLVSWSYLSVYFVNLSVYLTFFCSLLMGYVLYKLQITVYIYIYIYIYISIFSKPLKTQYINGFTTSGFWKSGNRLRDYQRVWCPKKVFAWVPLHRIRGRTKLLMLFLFVKTTKPLNQFAKKNSNEVSIFGATDDDFSYHFWHNISSPKIFCYTQVLINLSFMQSIRKRNKPFWSNSTSNRHKKQRFLQRKANNTGKGCNNNFNNAY